MSNFMDENSKVEEDNLNCPLNCCKSLKSIKIWNVLRTVNLMIFMLMLGFSVALQFNYRDSLIYRQLCKDRFQNDSKFCYIFKKERNAPHKAPEILELINSSSTHVFAMIGLKIVVECFSSCLLCSWSDACGRKIPLFIALLGENFDVTYFFVSDLSFVHFIWAFYLFTILSGLFGGYICILTMSYCYLSDSHSVKYRALSFTMIDFTFVMGIIIGVLTFKKLILGNAVLVNFATLLIMRFILIIWMLVTFGERHFDLMEEKLSHKLKKLFSIIHVKRTYDAVRKWRSNCQKEQLLLITFSAIPVMIAYSLIEGVIFNTAFHARLFEKYTDYEEITLYFAFYTCFAEPIAIAIYQYLANFKDSTLGIIGFWNLYLSSFIASFSIDYLTFIVGLGVAPLKGFTVVALRSAYSKIAEDDERGKLFFLYATSEVSAMFFGYLLYYKLKMILSLKEDILPYMVMSMALIVSFCTFIFQVMSIQTDHLFERCYRNIDIRRVTSIQDVSPSNREMSSINRKTQASISNGTT